MIGSSLLSALASANNSTRTNIATRGESKTSALSVENQREDSTIAPSTASETANIASKTQAAKRKSYVRDRDASP